MTREIIIAGAGVGSLTLEVQEALKNADVIFAASRFVNLVPSGKKVIDIKNYSQLENETGKIIILVSGDTGIFSLLPVLQKKFTHENFTLLPGISSLQVICARAGEVWNDAKIFSGHGRDLDAGKFLNAVERNRITILFCDKVISPKWACEKLACLDVEVFIGSNLGSPDEKIFHGSPANFTSYEFPELSIILIKNENFYTPEKIFLRNSDFIPEKHMTKEAVRFAILSRLELDNSSIFWDIGAGSGSISVSVGYANPEINIHAVEFRPEALSIISRNIKKFHLHNIHVHDGRAIDVIKTLPEPSHVFIGGSSGELAGVLEYLSQFRRVHVVIACVTLETFNTAYSFMAKWENFESLQISASTSKSLAQDMTLMKADNPVIILSANNKQKFSN